MAREAREGGGRGGGEEGREEGGEGREEGREEGVGYCLFFSQEKKKTNVPTAMDNLYVSSMNKICGPRMKLLAAPFI